MRNWSRLSKWADEEAHAGQLYLNVAQAARRYAEGRVALWRDPELQFALSWREKEKPTPEWADRYDPSFAPAMAFLDASKKERDDKVQRAERRRRRELRRSRIALTVLSAGFVLVTYLGYKAWKGETAAELATYEAAQQRDGAYAMQKRAQAEKRRAEDEKRSAEESRKVAEQERERAEHQRVRAETQTELAKKQSKLADSARERATLEQKKAIESEREARENARKAEAAQHEALALRDKADEQRNTADT